MRAKTYCAELGRSPVQLLFDWLRAADPQDLSQAKKDGRQLIFTQSGRAAIALAARTWRIGAKDEVLVPAYQCGSEVSPLIATGARVQLYRIDERAQIVIEDLLRRVTSRTRLICVTHYFGRLAEIGELVSFCQTRNIKLLEDCALSLFSDQIGYAGDAAIFSLRKSLPVPDGGMLLLRDADSFDFTPRKSAMFQTTRGALSLIKKWSNSWAPFNLISRRLHELDDVPPSKLSLPDIPSSYYWTANSVIRSASRFALGMLQRADSQEIVRKRRENYSCLRQHLEGTPGLRFLWEEPALTKGICPLGLPVLVDNRRYWWRRLNAAGVPVSCWWEGYHQGLDWVEFPEARTLKDHLILLPIHQDLTFDHINYFAEVIHSTSKDARVGFS